MAEWSKKVPDKPFTWWWFRPTDRSRKAKPVWVETGYHNELVTAVSEYGPIDKVEAFDGEWAPCNPPDGTDDLEANVFRYLGEHLTIRLSTLIDIFAPGSKDVEQRLLFILRRFEQQGLVSQQNDLILRDRFYVMSHRGILKYKSMAG